MMPFLSIDVAIGRWKRWGRAMREALQAYVKRVGELAGHVRGNEQATKPILVGPLFTILGDDLTDPRECIPEYRLDFGPNRSVKPADRKPVLANVINAPSRQRTLTGVLDNPARSEPQSGSEAAAGGRIETTQEGLVAPSDATGSRTAERAKRPN
jgi:hypothetical protein